MALREFTDTSGTRWRVWAVIPQMAERRRPRAPDEEPPVLERRKRNEPRIALTDGHAAGWLTFESPAEKRRLSPIPGGWEELGEAGLQSLLRVASTLRKSSRLIE